MQTDTHTRPEITQITQSAPCVQCVYLGDSNPADTGVRWGSRSQSWGPTAAGIARPCRPKPCRYERGEGGWWWGGGSWLAPSLDEARRSSPAAGGRCRIAPGAAPAAPRWAAWRGGGATRSAPPPSDDDARLTESKYHTPQWNSIWKSRVETT